MGKPGELKTMTYENNANDLSTLFASLLPVGREQVTMFLNDAAFALGGREADLASMIGVSRATLSGWKARGAIPEKHFRWFIDEFPQRVIYEFRTSKAEDYRHVGIEVALHLLEMTEFNPFGLVNLDKSDILHRCYLHFGGLTRFCFFILHRIEWDDLESIFERTSKAAKIASAIIPALANRT